MSDFNAGRLREAASALETLERQAPATAEVEELLGLVLSAESDNRGAYVRFLKAVRLKPGWAAARANLAVNLSKLGKLPQAEAEFKRAIATDPGDYEAYSDLGQFYLRQGKVAQALTPLEKAQSLHPSYRNGYNLALAYAQTNRLRDAQHELEELLKANDISELHNLLAEVEERLGNYVAAAKQYQRAAEMNPSEENLFDWGAELLIHRTFDPAIAVFSDALKRFPNSPRLLVGLGLANYGKGSYDDAVKALVKAADLTPSDPRAYYFLSKAYDRSPSQATQVIECFRRFAELRPRDGEAQLDYALSIWKGNEGAAPAALQNVELLLKRAVALDPSLSQGYFQLGIFYASEKRFAEAVPVYQESIRLKPNSPDAHYRLGQAYARLGKRDLARREFQLHQSLYNQHLAEVDRQRAEVRQFVYSLKKNPADIEHRTRATLIIAPQ
ncbi:MAG: tetratricopeptide repeat protein [Terriglobia bacterium]